MSTAAFALFTAPGSLFSGLPAEVIDGVLASARSREYAAGEPLIVEGEHPKLMFLVLDGFADVFIDGRGAQQQLINRVGPGSILGEMSLLSGEPASATVRATAPLHALTLTRDQVRALADRQPRIYQNIGANLALKIARADRRSVGHASGTLTWLDSRDAPPHLARALAASIAWHARQPTLLLRLHKDAAQNERPSGPGAHEIVVPADGRFGPHQLAHTLDDLRRRYEHILVESTSALNAPRVVLLGPATPNPANTPAQRTLLTLRGFTGSVPARSGPDARGVLHVPALRTTDAEAVSAGLLTSATPAGAQIGWAARHITRRKVGLALGGGGLKGYAHLGVLRALERAGLHVDYLAGTSIGGVVASLYALNHAPDTIADVLDAAAETLVRPALSTRSLLSADRLRGFLRRQGECVTFDDLPLPLALVACDIYSGREVVFRSGLIWPAVLATVAVPGLFPAQPIGPYRLVDGGVLNPVPADVARDMGADVVVAVRLRDERPLGQAEARATIPTGQSPSMLEVMTRSVDLLQGRLSPRAEAAADVLIEPRCEGAPSLGLRSFSRGRRYIKAGEAAAMAALPSLSRAIPWLVTSH
ncbi:MAG: patatin-like phospholipase family protein [Chloroflexi bacterium]|nr:patatin-like phospholipase family protein [Chloroflexota bacterium]